MAEAFGTAASVIGLIGTAFSIFQEVRKAQAKVKGASKSLQAVTGYVESVEQSLNLVEREPALQTPQIIQQLTAIGEIALNLREFLDQLVVQQQRRAVAQFVHALKAGDAEEKELDKILGRLDQGRSELVLRIQLAQVGLMGNMQSGFRVAFGVLNETNNRVNSILGVNLELAELLKGRQYRETDGTIALEATDIQRLQLSEETPPLESTASIKPVETSNKEANSDSSMASTSIYDNITEGQARIMDGDVGVEQWHRRAKRKAIINNNHFKGDVTIMTGDVGGVAAEKFMDNFWK